MPELKARWETNLKIGTKKTGRVNYCHPRNGRGRPHSRIFRKRIKKNLKIFESENWVTAYTAKTQHAEQLPPRDIYKQN